MVNTRAQTSQNNPNREDEMNDYDDNSSDISLQEFSTRTFELENIVNNFSEQEREHERVRIERRFNEMNRQIRELYPLVRTLMDRIFPSNREENGSNSSQNRSQAILTLFTDCFLCNFPIVTQDFGEHFSPSLQSTGFISYKFSIALELSFQLVHSHFSVLNR